MAFLLVRTLHLHVEIPPRREGVVFNRRSRHSTTQVNHFPNWFSCQAYDSKKRKLLWANSKWILEEIARGDCKEGSCSLLHWFTLTDVIPPILMGCPLDISVSLNENSTALANWSTPIALDNSNLAPQITISLRAVSLPHVFNGTTLVTYTAEDASGNRKGLLILSHFREQVCCVVNLSLWAVFLKDKGSCIISFWMTPHTNLVQFGRN